MNMKNTLITFLLLIAAITASAQDFSVFQGGAGSDIRPEGWLKEFLLRQKSGMTGHPEALSYPYDSCLWNGEIGRNTETYGSDWWRYEQTAYYTDGLIRLGYLIEDQDMVDTAVDGINYTLAHASDKGVLGNPKIESMWPMCVYFRVLEAYYESTGDQRVIDALHKHYLNFTSEEIGNWRNIVSLEGMLWVYGKTGDRKLLERCEKAWNAGTFIDLVPETCRNDERLVMHGVTCAEELKLPMLLYAYTGNEMYHNLALNAEYKLTRDHMLPDGVPASAEALVGNENIINSHETCDITDYTWSLIKFLTVTGDAKWADKIERAVFNAGPGAITKDFKSLQYFSSVNQVIATGNNNHNEFFHGSTWMAFRPTHETECCSGNAHRFMPDYTAYTWLRGNHDEITAALYAPTTYRFRTKDAVDCTIEEKTLYPFDGLIDFKFSLSAATTLSFCLRIPEWSADSQIRVNGKLMDMEMVPGTFVKIERAFSDGDHITLSLDMSPRITDVRNQGLFITRGPLLYSFSVPHSKEEDTKVYANMNGKVPGNPDFKCWSMIPTGKWNYALDLSHASEIVTEKNDSYSVGDYPYDEGNSPYILKVPAKEIAWQLDSSRYTPVMPKGGFAEPIKDNTVWLDLVPYGSTELRLTVFPRTVNHIEKSSSERIKTLDPLVNPIKGISPDSQSSDTVCVARGEHAVFQFMIDSLQDGSTIEASSGKFKSPSGSVLKAKPEIGWVKYVCSRHNYTPSAPDALLPSDAMYPDPIVISNRTEVDSSTPTVMYLDISIPDDTEPGLYNGRINLNIHNGASLTKEVYIEVFPVQLEEQSLLVSNWYFPEEFKHMNNGKEVIEGSRKYKKCKKEVLTTAAAYGQNVWLLYEKGEPYIDADGNIAFNFQKMDKSIKEMLSCLPVKFIEGNHIAKRSTNRWTDPFWVLTPIQDKDGKFNFVKLSLDDQRAVNYVKDYFRCLSSHLKSQELGDGRSWLDIYVQHVGDEPIKENIDSWEAIARIIKESAPDLKIIEAYRTPYFNQELIDIVIPQLDELEWPVYRNIPAHHQCWFYTCMYPRSNYANRYVTLPLIKTRILHWINFKYETDGYLHWGLNSWSADGDPWKDVSAPANDWPGGDSHIIYPAYMKVYPSIRFKAMRDGINDYTLLQMVAKRSPITAQNFVNKIIWDYSSYDTSVVNFRSIRREILEYLSLY